MKIQDFTGIKRLAIASITLILAGQGCLGGGTSTLTDKVSENASAPKENRVAVVAGNCTNPYMLLRQGSSITYSTEVEGKAYTYIQKVKENNGKKVILAYKFPESGLDITQTIDCKTNGIFAEGFLDFGSILSGTTV